VILETFGAGNAPTVAWFLDLLKEAVDNGVILFNVTQCKGRQSGYREYETSAELGTIGVIGGTDITTEIGCYQADVSFGMRFPEG